MEGLEAVGSRLGLSAEDVNDLKKERRRWGWLLGIGGVILAVILFFLGMILGGALSGNDSSSSGDSYPFAVSAFGIGRMNGKRIWRWQLPALFGLGFLTGISKPVFGNGVRYGVFRKE